MNKKEIAKAAIFATTFYTTDKIITTTIHPRTLMTKIGLCFIRIASDTAMASFATNEVTIIASTIVEKSKCEKEDEDGESSRSTE